MIKQVHSFRSFQELLLLLHIPPLVQICRIKMSYTNFWKIRKCDWACNLICLVSYLCYSSRSRDGVVVSMKVDLGQNVRFVVSSFCHVVSWFCYGVSSFQHADFWSRLGELPVRFVGWSPLSFRRFVFSSCRFVVSLCRFVISTRPLREAIIRRTLHEVLTLFHALIHNVFIRNLLSAATEKGFFEELPTAQHRIRVKSSEWAVSWQWKWNRMSSYTLWQSFEYSACIFVT